MGGGEREFQLLLVITLHRFLNACFPANFLFSNGIFLVHKLRDQVLDKNWKRRQSVLKWEDRLRCGHGDVIHVVREGADKPSVTELRVNFLMERPLVATCALWTVP